jgi:L-alanine-DL-glutamate epimerase-like enolase superfamily enzyme
VAAPRIARIDLVRHPAEPDLVHVLVADDAGTVGTGETHGHPAAVAALLGELGPALAGIEATPPAVAEVTGRGPYGGPRGGGHVSVESRAASALDVALHDLAARRVAVPLAAFLGGAAGEVTPYTTCVDADHEAVWSDPAGLARSVADDGFALLKVWPFTPGGDHPAAVERVAAACGAGVAVAVDLYGVLADDEAATVCRLLDPLGLAWIEDPVADGREALLTEMAGRLATPVCAGERLAGPDAHAALLRTGVDIVHVDVAWCGGVSAAVEVAGLVRAAGRRLALHDVSGPVTWATSLQLAQAVAVPVHVECARLAVAGRYRRIAEGLPDPRTGRPPDGSGHGLELAPSYLADAVVERLV